MEGAINRQFPFLRRVFVFPRQRHKNNKIPLKPSSLPSPPNPNPTIRFITTLFFLTSHFSRTEPLFFPISLSPLPIPIPLFHTHTLILPTKMHQICNSKFKSTPQDLNSTISQTPKPPKMVI